MHVAQSLQLFLFQIFSFFLFRAYIGWLITLFLQLYFDFQIVSVRRGRSILNRGGLLCPEFRLVISEFA